MKRLLIFIIFLYGSTAIGQNLLPMQMDTLPIKQKISLYGNGFIFGNTLRNEFTEKLLLGGFISDDIKQRSMMHMRDINRLAGVATAEINYENFQINLFGKPNWGMVVRAGYETFNAIQFPKTIFQLGFQGNANLDSKSLSIGNTHIISTSFQKIGFGIIDKKSKSSLVLNFINGSSFYRGDLSKSTYYQSPNSDSIRLTLDGEMAYNNEKRFSNGQGFAFDANYQFGVKWGKERTAYFQIKARNIGIVFYNHPTQHYVIDTSYNYTGFSFHQLMNNSNKLGKDFSLMDSLNIHPTSKSAVLWLPGYIQIGKVVNRSSPHHWQSFFGINLYTTAISLPQVYAGVHYQPNHWFAAGANVSYGGFGGFRGGLYIDFSLPRLSIGIATNDLYGVISKRGYGLSSQIRLAWKIK